MRTHKRRKFSRGFVNTLRLRSSEIFCDECGTIYDDRTGEGLCRYCGDDTEETRDEGSKTEG
jgi:hypothetical protein